MLTKAQIKTIASLRERKGRQEQGRFVAEGQKTIVELLGAFHCDLLLTTAEQYQLIAPVISGLEQLYRPKRIEIVEETFDFKKLSSMVSPQQALAVFLIPEGKGIGREKDSGEGLALLLDDVQDPGNVGTIIRTASWFGVRRIYLTAGCADPYSPKVIQATMGALANVELRRVSDLGELANRYAGSIYGTFLSGENIYTAKLLGSRALLVMGNEGNGISSQVEDIVTTKLTIPCLAPNPKGVESLNVATATAICISELLRPH